jgi:hypothetical protein
MKNHARFRQFFGAFKRVAEHRGIAEAAIVTCAGPHPEYCQQYLFTA